MTTLVIDLMTSEKFNFGHFFLSYKAAHLTNALGYVFIYVLNIRQIIASLAGLCLFIA